jgi:integrase
VQELADEYIEKWAKPRKRTWKKDDLILKKDILPEWKNRKAKDITRRDVVLILDKILKRKAPIQANRTLAVIRKMFNFALGRDIVEFNPCIGVKSPSQENQRDRVLSEAEIKTFWEKLDITDMHKNTRNAYKLMLLTGQRIGEVVSSRWQDMDLDKGWWVIPAEQSKNKLQHRVSLSSQALAVIKDIKQYAVKADDKEDPDAKNDEKNELDGKAYLFPSPRQGQHIDVTATAHALKRNRAKLGIAEFKPHDIRRTAASHMTGMGISRLVVSKILNHVESHITAVYDRYSYDAEKQKALNAWGKKVSAILKQVNNETQQAEIIAMPKRKR